MRPFLHRLFWRVMAAVDYAFILSALWLHDRIAGPAAESPTNRAVREEGERLNRASCLVTPIEAFPNGRYAIR